MTLEAFGNTKLSMLNSFIVLMTNVGLNIALIPEHGIIGAAIATATSLIIGGLLGVIEIYVLYRLQPFRLGHFKYLTAALSIGFILYIIQLQFTKLTFLVLIVMIIILAGLYIAGLFLTRSFDTLDYQVFTRVKAKITG
jgi:O-antigen/teichoic acid export membrane protein